MRMTDIIEHKKQGLKLTKEEIEFFVRGYTKGDIPDYQAAALAMAVYFNKMDNEETADLTLAMAHSGDMLDLSEFGNSTVDKHSSGGVGDKTTLIVAPIACAAGRTVDGPWKGKYRLTKAVCRLLSIIRVPNKPNACRVPSIRWQ